MLILPKLILQTFARKLIKPYGTVTLTDILNELRAVEKLCRSGHDHVVEVFRHGKLIGSDLYYFIDMEFCEGSLDDYICGKPIGKEGLILNANSPNTRAIDYCWIIISDICDGLTFIHHAKEVHRDLKPFNGKTSLQYQINELSSIVLNRKCSLENHRFRARGG